MWISILGSLEVRDDRGRPVQVGGLRLRALLARLALGAGRVVGAETLIDDLWGAQPPDGAVNALQRLVSRLRRVLPDSGAGTVLHSEAGGYRLAVATEDVDALHFQRLAAAGRRALAAGEHGTAAELLREAERLWRGPALTGLGDVPFAAAAAVRLDDLRLVAAEARFDVELALGRHEAIVDEVEQLAAAHPLRERLQGQLMRALYATGRQAEALAVYERVRGALAEELGADPSAELAAVHLAVLRQAPELTPEHPHPAAAEAPAALRPPAAPAAPLTSFVGREEELRTVAKLLQAARLVTVVGPGGAGKSRLATELLTRLPPQDRGAAWFVELAPVTSPTDLPQAVMATLGIREQALLEPGPLTPRATRDAFARLAEALGHRQVLLVLDNCEHVLDAAAQLTGRLLAACPDLRILATSREPLGIPGEQQYPIPPLSLPPGDTLAAEALAYPAVRLLAERAAAVRPDFAVTDGNVAAVVEVCRRLDGLPLAIELAAARLRILSPAQIASRLDDRFQLLTGGSRTALPRHQTLRAVVAWSWDLLTEPERVLARRLSVFAGGATLEAAEAVCSGGDLPRSRVLDTLGALVEKSLLEAAEPGTRSGSAPAGMRYRMLETIRAYAAERLAEAGETQALKAAYARHYLEVAEAAEPRLRTGEQPQALAVLRAEQPNLLAALRWALDAGDHEVAVRLCAALMWYWILRGNRYDSATVREVLALPGDEWPTERAIVATVHAMALLAFGYGTGDGDSGRWAIAQARERARRADLTRHPLLAVLGPMAALSEQDPDRIQRELDRLVSGADPWTSAMARMFRGFLNRNRVDPADAWQDLSAARDAFGRLGDRWGRSLAAQGMATVRSLVGDPAGAAAAYREAVADLEEVGAVDDIPVTLAQIGHELARGGDLEGARAEFTRALQLADRYGSPEATTSATYGLGSLARRSGDLAGARRCYEEALAAVRPGTSEEQLRPVILSGIASVAVWQGELGVARECLRQAVELASGSVDMVLHTAVAHALASLAVAEGGPDRAAVLLGTAACLRGTLDRLDPDVAQVEARAREQLGDAAYQEAYRRGASRSREDAVASLRAAAATLPQ